MPIWASLIRLLRRRMVLGLIFGLSLTYCAVSLLRHEGREVSLENDFEDMDENAFLNDNDENSDEQVSVKSLIWEMDVLEENNVDSLEPPATGQGNNSDIVANCRNSVQGKVLIVDEKGYVCFRKDVLASGCCNPDLPKISQDEETPSLIKRDRYSCETCNPQGCCAIYEYCVSCCLHPGKHRARGKKLSEAEQETKARKGEDILKLRLRALDRFQFCLAACRTSSASVRHENTYKNPHSKHCYNLHALSSHRRSQRDLVSVNNNVITSSSVVLSSQILLPCHALRKLRNFVDKSKVYCHLRINLRTIFFNNIKSIELKNYGKKKIDFFGNFLNDFSLNLARFILANTIMGHPVMYSTKKCLLRLKF